MKSIKLHLWRENELGNVLYYPVLTVGCDSGVDLGAIFAPVLNRTDLEKMLVPERLLGTGHYLLKLLNTIPLELTEDISWLKTVSGSNYSDITFSVRQKASEYGATTQETIDYLEQKFSEQKELPFEVFVMPETVFWQYFECPPNLSYAQQESVLSNHISQMNRETALSFKHRFDSCLKEMMRHETEFSTIGQAMMGFPGPFMIYSHITATDFIIWIIQRGKKVYEAALSDPESIRSLTPPQEYDVDGLCHFFMESVSFDTSGIRDKLFFG